MIPAHVRIFVCPQPVDFRRGFDGLALAARERLGEDPRAGGLFVFTNRRATGVKIAPGSPIASCARPSWRVPGAPSSNATRTSQPSTAAW
jgi:hypothetical protein